jgi:hypothetical protein
MTEGAARYIAAGFAITSALLMPVAFFVDVSPLNATALAGATLVLVYFAANARLLVISRAEWRERLRDGTRIRIAFYLGAVLMVCGIIQAIVTSS